MYLELTTLYHFKVIADGHTYTQTHMHTHPQYNSFVTTQLTMCLILSVWSTSSCHFIYIQCTRLEIHFIGWPFSNPQNNANNTLTHLFVWRWNSDRWQEIHNNAVQIHTINVNLWRGIYKITSRCVWKREEQITAESLMNFQKLNDESTPNVLLNKVV